MQALFAVLVALFLAAAHASGEARSSSGIAVFGYLPEYRLAGFNYEAAFQNGLTHLIYFSLEIDTVTSLPSAKDRLPKKADARRARIAADKVGGKILLGFGGNARSQGFPKMVLDPNRRQQFINSLNDLLLEYEMDGVDYNWEYPSNAREWSEWGILLQQSKAQLLGGQNIVTFTMYLDPNHYDLITRFNLLQHADFVHCMAYDQHGEHSTYDFAMSGILYAQQKNFPLKKFTLGVPFYARSTRNGNPKTYGEIWGQLLRKHQEDPTKVPRNVDTYGQYYFNSQDMIRKKTELSMDSGIGGIMIWELGQDVQPMDQEHSLMKAIAQVTMKNNVRPPLEEDRASLEL